MPIDREVINQLTPAEKLELVEELWDDLADGPQLIPAPQWHFEELERRRELMEKNPAAAFTWEEAREILRAKHGC